MTAVEVFGWVCLGGIVGAIAWSLVAVARALWSYVPRAAVGPVDAHAATVPTVPTVPTDEPASRCMCPPPGCGTTPCKTYAERYAY
jgi:hypothetical protein